MPGRLRARPDPGLVRVVQRAQRGRAGDVGAGDRGQGDPDGRGPERVLRDALRPLDAQRLPAGPRLVLQLAHLEQERGGSGEGMLGIFGTGQASLLPDVDAAADQAADETLVSQGPDRGLDRHAADAKEAGQLIARPERSGRLITRNVARLVELPGWAPKAVEPWSPTEAPAFLAAGADDPLYPAFVLLLLYGMRRGEVLGLPWHDIDLERRLCMSGGAPAHQWRASYRPREDPSWCSRSPLARPGQRRSDGPAHSPDADRARLGSAWPETGLVFTTRTGRPVEPRNLVRSFTRLCDADGVRKSACMLSATPRPRCSKDLGVRRATLRSSSATPTSPQQQVYTHVDEAARLDAITKLNKLLGGTE